MELLPTLGYWSEFLVAGWHQAAWISKFGLVEETLESGNLFSGIWISASVPLFSEWYADQNRRLYRWVLLSNGSSPLDYITKYIPKSCVVINVFSILTFHVANMFINLDFPIKIQTSFQYIHSHKVWVAINAVTYSRPNQIRLKTKILIISLTWGFFKINSILVLILH